MLQSDHDQRVADSLFVLADSVHRLGEHDFVLAEHDFRPTGDVFQLSDAVRPASGFDDEVASSVFMQRNQEDEVGTTLVSLE